MTAIPKKLHQMWLDRNDPNMVGLPPNYPIYKTYTESWKHHHPEFEYKLWNNRDIAELWQHPRLNKYKRFYEEVITRQIERCDFARYAVMAVYGGVYVDLDFFCQRNISPLLVDREIGLSKDVAEHSQVVGDMVFNGFLVSIPEHPFWFQLLDTIMENYRPEQSVLQNTGPKLLSRLFQFNEATELPHCLILPLNGAQQIAMGCNKSDYEKAYCYTKWYEGSYWYLEGVKEKMAVLVRSWPLLLLAIVLMLLILAVRY